MCFLLVLFGLVWERSHSRPSWSADHYQSLLSHLFSRLKILLILHSRACSVSSDHEQSLSALHSIRTAHKRSCAAVQGCYWSCIRNITHRIKINFKHIEVIFEGMEVCFLFQLKIPHILLFPQAMQKGPKAHEEHYSCLSLSSDKIVKSQWGEGG